ncbi:MAG: SCO1664 family protein [Anaerolineae bacterium]|nr:MAG: SCO1664 family protein [Anaerolineae bacterium]
MRSKASVLHSLRTGEISFQGQFAVGSNHTFLVEVNTVNGPMSAVYKPSNGEQPLWDFPGSTLALREVAAFKTSEALGWDLVPPTTLREDGPAGGGSLQLYLDVEPTRNYFTFSEGEKQLLRPAALFDVLINNADRKAGHVIHMPEGHIQLIDHGVCFHEEHKLRTVIWDFAGEAIPSALLRNLQALTSKLEDQGTLSLELAGLLSSDEIRALRERNSWLFRESHFPEPGPQRNYPWPLV